MRNTIIIYADDDLERLGDLRRNVAIAERAVAEGSPDARRIGDENPAVEQLERAKAAYDAFVDEAAERADAWVLSSIGHGEFRALVRDHPPRKVDNDDPEGPKHVTHLDDAELGLNTETFGKALLLYVDEDDPEIRTVIAPEDGLAKRVKRLSAGQFDSLWVAAYYLNVGGVVDPKLLRFSTAATSSAT